MKPKTKKLLAIILLFAVSSGVIITALVMLPSPVKHAITPGPQLVDLTNLSENITRLTINPGPDENPVWSVDGKRIFFELRQDLGVSRYGPECYICVMDADGSNKELLLSLPYDPYTIGMGLAWSPDGSKIAFDCYMIDVVNNDIYVIGVPAMDEAEGGEIKRPTETSPLTSEVYQTPDE